MVVPVTLVMRMIVAILVAMASSGIVRMVVAIAFSGAMVMPIAFGVGTSAFHFLVGIGGGLFGLAAGEKEGSDSEGCEVVFHGLLVFGLKVVCVCQ